MAVVQKDVAALMAASSRPLESTWLIDTAAAYHVCRNKKDFNAGTFRRKRRGDHTHVVLRNGLTIPSLGRGLVTLDLGPEKSMTIEAIFVPRLHSSIISVSMLAGRHHLISFDSHVCLLDDLVLGNFRDGSYHYAGNIRSASNSRRSTQSSANATRTTKPSLELWHKRLGHLDVQSLKTLLDIDESVQDNASTAIPQPIDDDLEEEEDYTTDDDSTLACTCKVCIKAKLPRQRKKPSPRATQPFELIRSGLYGPITTPSLSGARYFLLFLDDYSRVAWVYFLVNNSAQDVTSRFQEFQALVKTQFNASIQRFKCDHGQREYDNKTFSDLLYASGITFETSPLRNGGVSEQTIQTIATKARAMLLDSRLDDTLWAEAVSTAVYLYARSPSQSVGGKTPYEVLYGKKPTINHLRRFGCVAYKLIPEELRKRMFAPLSTECVMIGYVHESTSIWRLWEYGRKVSVASGVQFDETKVVGTRDVASLPCI